MTKKKSEELKEQEETLGKEPEGEETEGTNLEALKEKAEKADEYLDKYQRTLAEYDNFRKRTVKEKEQLVTDAKIYAVTGLIPVLDNLERASAAAENESDENPLKQGVEMIFRSVIEEFEKLGVKEIEALGESFDPNFHNAVMHIEDETVAENTVVEVFQKGYKIGDKVIRPSMVKVAN
ncbi:MAG: nucleotide exchange factor GrpE [Clostridia bacterium]|nr:nucleotide exchange factor GrpE [Clostridia bacterium]